MQIVLYWEERKVHQRASHSEYQMVQQTRTMMGMSLKLLMAQHLEPNLALQKESSYGQNWALRLGSSWEASLADDLDIYLVEMKVLQREMHLENHWGFHLEQNLGYLWVMHLGLLIGN